MKIVITALLILSCSIHSVNGQEWIPIFDGQSTEGWTHVGDGGMVLEEGVLRTEGGMGLLYYDKIFHNVELKVIYKNPGGKNAGVFIRIPEKPEDAWMPVNKGYEVQIDDSGDAFHCTGVLYSISQAMNTPELNEDWNTMTITLLEKITEVRINGTLVTRFEEGQEVPEKKIWYEPDRGPRPAKGYIGLQNHGEDDVVYFKEVSYRVINTEE